MSNIEKIRQKIERRRHDYGKRMLQPDGMVARAKFDELTVLLAFIDYLPNEPGRMKPIYDNKDNFESALAKAWDEYHNGYERVDSLEDDYVECAHAKGFREGYLFGITHNLDETSKNIFRNGVTVGSEITRREESKYGKQLREYFENRPEEDPSEDLEEAAEEYADDNFEQWVEDDEIYSDSDKIRETFIAGAKWQKEQLK